MKKARKLLITLLILTFVLSTVSVGFAAVNDNSPEVVRAKALGILRGDDKGNLNLDKPITRAEALALIIRISGLEGSADLMKGQTKFADVAANHWASGYINLGVGQGIVNGYPDGTFKPNDNVTYAQMAKMLLYAMNYGVTVEGAPWPAGVMGKADDLGLFDDVNATPNVPALRGDVVKMIDNSLTVKHLVQEGYGDLKTYKEGDKTFLSKLKVTELKDVKVTEIAKVNSKLDDDEIKLDDDVYTLKANVTPEQIFGLTVDAWVNDDDEVFFVKVKTEEKDILFDTVDAADKDKVTLKVADDDFDWADDAVVYVNFEKAKKLENVPVGAYGEVILEKGEVVFANFFTFDGVGVVTNVDGDLIEYVANDAQEEELDLEDADAVYVYNPDFTKADIDDIDKDSAIFFWEDSNEYYIIVKNEVVKGTLERIKASSIRIDGKDYDKADLAVATLDEGDSYISWTGIDSIKDLTDEEVRIVLDLNGDAIFIASDVDVTSDTIYGIATYGSVGKKGEVTLYTKDDEEVDYVAEDRNDLQALDGLKYFGDADVTSIDGVSLSFAAMAIKLNSDGEIDESFNPTTDMKIVTYNNGSLTSTNHVTLTKSADKTYVNVAGGGRYYITKDTVLMKALNSDGELDPSVLKYDSFVKSSFSSGEEAIVFGDLDKTAKFIVFLDKAFEGVDDDTYFGVVTSGPWKQGSNYYVTIDVFGEGEKDYVVANKDQWAKGYMVEFKLNNDDKAVRIAYQTISTTGSTITVDGDYITVSGATYKVADGVVIYDFDEDHALNKKVRYSKLNTGDKILYMVDDEEIVVALVTEYASAGDGGSGDTGATVTATISGTTVTINVAGDDDAYAVRVYDAETGETLSGFAALDEDGNASFTVTEDPVFIKVKVYDDSMNMLFEKLVTVTSSAS